MRQAPIRNGDDTAVMGVPDLATFERPLWRGKIGDTGAMKQSPRHRVGHRPDLAGAGMIRVGVIGVS